MAAEDQVPKTPVGQRRPSSKRAELICDVGRITSPDLGTVDALARFRLWVEERGLSVHLRHATTRLQELLDLCGLSDALPVCEESALVDQGQSEPREEPGRVEEEVEPGDPAP